MARKLREMATAEFGKDPERALVGVQNAIAGIVGGLNRIPFLSTDGVLYTGTLANGSNVISHKLGRVPVGWIVTRSTVAACSVYEVARDKLTIELSSTGTPTVEIWFF